MLSDSSNKLNCQTTTRTQFAMQPVWLPKCKTQVSQRWAMAL